ncbi:MAG: prepilin-type N-terminal cleavage/methylation domain-containing protein [Candidatus Moraniibacteriota bacterium]
MKKRLRGFTFIEVILYLALFSFLGTALFEFTWDTLELREQGSTERALTEEARFATERIKYLIRNSSVDVASSVWDSVDGKLVLDVLGSSDTITIERQNERVVMQVSGQDVVVLQSQDSRSTTLLFERAYSADESAQYVDMTLTLETLLTAPPEYTTSLTLQTGIFVRNFGL